jgi:hypothetical protein
MILNEPPAYKTQVKFNFSAYSTRSEGVFNDILKMHPKFKPKHFERSHHIFCIKLEQNKKNKVTVDELKLLADFICDRMDIPVSVQADGETVSIAYFWDVRLMG